MNTIKEHKYEADKIINDLTAKLNSMIATNKDFQDYFEDKITKYLNDIKTAKYRGTAENGTEQRRIPEGSDCHPKRLDASDKGREDPTFLADPWGGWHRGA